MISKHQTITTIIITRGPWAKLLTWTVVLNCKQDYWYVILFFTIPASWFMYKSLYPLEKDNVLPLKKKPEIPPPPLPKKSCVLCPVWLKFSMCFWITTFPNLLNVYLPTIFHGDECGSLFKWTWISISQVVMFISSFIEMSQWFYRWYCYLPLSRGIVLFVNIQKDAMFSVCN